MLISVGKPHPTIRFCRIELEPTTFLNSQLDPSSKKKSNPTTNTISDQPTTHSLTRPRLKKLNLFEAVHTNPQSPIQIKLDFLKFQSRII